ncbi:hypothetical protein ACX3O0_14090 [Homoserinimonas sp. A447]
MTTVGYRLLLPEGWVRLTVRDGLEANLARVDGALDKAGAAGLDDQARELVSTTMRSWVAEALAAAARQSIVQLFVPIATRHEAILPLSISIATIPEKAAEPLGRGEYPQRWSGHPSDSLEVGSGWATRFETEEHTGSGEQELRLRRLDYFVSVGDDANPRILMTGTASTTLGEVTFPPEAVDVFLDLLDAIMATFRWVAADPLDLEAGARLDR